MDRRGVFALYYGLAVLCGALYAVNPHFLSAPFIAGFLVACMAIRCGHGCSMFTASPGKSPTG